MVTTSATERGEPGHPREDVRFTSAWGARDVLAVALVRPERPELVAEVRADTSVDRGGIIRHQMRFQGLRLGVSVEDVAGLGEGHAVAAR